MDDFRIGSLGFNDSLSGQSKDESKKRSRSRRSETQPELTDEVTLSGESEEQPLGYSPASPDKEPT
jgi:hypothetical protein